MGKDWTIETTKDVDLSPKQELLLLKSIKSDGYVSFEMAKSLYSGNDTATSALATLEFEDCVERVMPGRYRVVRIPENVHDKFKKWKRRKAKEASE